MKVDTGQKGEELYNAISHLMQDYSDGDRLFALGLLGVHTRRWLMKERSLNQQQADMLITLALNAAEDGWRKVEARNLLKG